MTDYPVAHRYAKSVSTSPGKFGKWRKKRDGFKMLLRPGLKCDIGRWKAFGWPSDDAADAERHFAALRTFDSGDVFAYYARDAAAIGAMLAVASDGQIVGESIRTIAILSKPGQLFKRVGKSLVVSIPDDVTVAETREAGVVVGTRSSAQYFHWMVEMVPRLLLARDIAREVGGKVYLRPIWKPFQFETIEAILPPGGYELLTEDVSPFRHAVFPDHAIRQIGQRRVILPFVKDGFDEIGKRRGQASERRRNIYVSRLDAPKRHLLNESEVRSLMQTYGIDVVTTSHLSVSQQAELFGSADLVVGTHGAGLTNIGFCRPGTKVIEFLPSRSRVLSPYYSLAGVCGLEYACVACSSATPEPPGMDDDYAVDIATLETAVREALRGISAAR